MKRRILTGFGGLVVGLTLLALTAGSALAADQAADPCLAMMNGAPSNQHGMAAMMNTPAAQNMMHGAPCPPCPPCP